MPRNMSAQLIAAFASGKLKPIILCEAEFVSGTVRLHSGLGELAWNGQTWLGCGRLGSISPATETAEIRADNFTVSFSGINQDDLNKALDECRSNKECTVYLGGLDDSGSVVPDLVIACRGYLDVPTVNEDTGLNTCTISITVETRMARLQDSSSMRYTDECQRQLFPGDGFFRFVTSIQDWAGTWGAATTSVPRSIGPVVSNAISR